MKMLTRGGSAFAGGAISGIVVTAVGEKIFPDSPQNAAYVPALLGAFLSVQKNEMISSAGLGMVGAMASTISENLGIGINGAAGPNRLNAARDYTRLNPEQKREAQLISMQRAQAASMNKGKQVDYAAYNRATETVN